MKRCADLRMSQCVAASRLCVSGQWKYLQWWWRPVRIIPADSLGASWLWMTQLIDPFPAAQVVSFIGSFHRRRESASRNFVLKFHSFKKEKIIALDLHIICIFNWSNSIECPTPAVAWRSPIHGQRQDKSGNDSIILLFFFLKEKRKSWIICV